MGTDDKILPARPEYSWVETEESASPGASTSYNLFTVTLTASLELERA